MAKLPDAFLSYTHFDDKHDRGAISKFRQRLADEVRSVTGAHFEIFQDIEGIGIGKHWPDTLDEMLNEARFFIPVVTPNYFTSLPCREELETFLRAEGNRKRDDLVLPIYYIKCDLFNDDVDSIRNTDPMAATLRKREYLDWTKLRFMSFDATTVRRTLHNLALEIKEARGRPMSVGERAIPVETAAAPPQSPADVDKPSLSERWRRRMIVIRGPSKVPEVATEKPESLRQDHAPQSKPGTVFRDVEASWCPEMVVIPPGEFMMGSTEPEKERPQHLVRIAYGLAVGRYPVTVEEYGHFAQSTQRTQPGDEGWGRGRRPVVNVSWEDANGYVEWLAGETRKAYRLLSEGEWEYACRAGTATRYWWGDEITPESANYGRNLGKTSEVGSYPANPFGLYDMQGNVWEWVEDRWHDSYNGAPDDGSAWSAGKDSRRVVRGGSWGNSRGVLRSAVRVRYDPANRGDGVGFRVARTLLHGESVAPLIKAGSKVEREALSASFTYSGKVLDKPSREAGVGVGVATARRRIFLAHASEDKPQVRRLYADLKARGLDPWLDEKDLVGGQIWKVEIPKAIRRSEVFLACLSRRSVEKRGFVQQELREALSAYGERPADSIYIVPVRLDECDVPDLQTPDRGLSLQDIHRVDLWREGGFDSLVAAIEHALGLDERTKSEPRTVFRALEVKDPHWSKLEYHDPELTGRVTFNYSNNDGRYFIGRDEFFFETKWSKASDQAIYLYSYPPSIKGIAEAPELQSYVDVKDCASYDMSSSVRTIQKGEHAIIVNIHNKCAVLRILDIKDRTRADTVDELTFDFWIRSDQ